MNTTLTIRTDKKMRQALEKRAKDHDITVSECVRQILQEAISERPLSQRIGHLKGGLELSDEPTDSWRQQLRQRNWRP